MSGPAKIYIRHNGAWHEAALRVVGQPMSSSSNSNNGTNTNPNPIGNLTYNYGAPAINTPYIQMPPQINIDLSKSSTFTCKYCGLSKSTTTRRIVYGSDGYSELWHGCVDCFGLVAKHGDAVPNLRNLLAQAAAYVQICHEGGDWDLVDRDAKKSAELLSQITYALAKAPDWDPSADRRSGKL